MYKKDSQVLAKNYRPISLTLIVVKLLETIVKPLLLNHLFSNGIIHDSQSGFLPNKSCVSSLLEVLEDWTYCIDRGLPVDVIYIDFEKAFDKVQHSILLDKLERIGVRGQLLSWFVSYLSNRRHRIKLGQSLSGWCSVPSGVPQGSVLGPILFLLYSYDSPSNSIHSLYKLNYLTDFASYADDTKLYSQSNSLNGYSSLKNSLSDVVKWSKINYMSLNLGKCQVLHLGKSNATFEYSVESHCIEETSIIKDLGVWIENKLKFSKHIALIASSANRLIELFKRTFLYITPNILKLFYKTFIRPRLEYANQIWSLFSKKDIDKLEKVQRRATKCIRDISNLPYRERLRIMGLICIENRRKIGDLILTWKIINGVSSISLKFPLVVRRINRCRGHSLYFQPPVDRPPMSKIRENFLQRESLSIGMIFLSVCYQLLRCQHSKGG